LYEITTLYAQLLRAVLAQRREREARLMTGDAVSASIAHEVKQPLGAIITSANAGLNWLDHDEPDLDQVKDALQLVVTAGHRADAVIENIRTHFKTSARTGLRSISTKSSRKLWPSFVVKRSHIRSPFTPTLMNGCRQ
jgi:hypothetical protein